MLAHVSRSAGFSATVALCVQRQHQAQARCRTSAMIVPITDVADWRLCDEEFLRSFRLPRKGAGVLALRFLFPRESRITFDEAGHLYTIDSLQAPRSVTGLLHEYASEFSPERALHAMKNGKDWDQKKAGLEEQSLGTDDEDILQRWQNNGEIARARGHLLHWQSEQMVNGSLVEEPHSPEFAQAKAIYEHLLGPMGLAPFRAEVNLLHT